jgi:hypothetical protein
VVGVFFGATAGFASLVGTRVVGSDVGASTAAVAVVVVSVASGGRSFRPSGSVNDGGGGSAGGAGVLIAVGVAFARFT